ncbi:hypothetical protein GHT06_014480 [Daphnia sinensis]|uniref:Uncharacterized protein n=1 Tax=Daphnia sinensis TaxID=1820382 RepID=A0AAD5PYX4_9CRUS|nr:hypothetical protein GHT06_014480 [Daphnia sinensis]
MLNSDSNNHDDSNNDVKEMEGGLTQDKDIIIVILFLLELFRLKRSMNSQLLPFESLEVYSSTSGGRAALKRKASCLQNRNSSSPVCGFATVTSPCDRFYLE